MTEPPVPDDQRPGDPPPDDHPAEDQEEHPLVAARLERHRERLAAGGYPYRFEVTATSAELHQRFAGVPPGTGTGERVTVAGRLMNTREMGRLVFGVLQDGTGRVQLFVDPTVVGAEGFADFAELDHGDIIGAEGEVMTTRRGELSVRIDRFELLAKSLRPLPEKWHGLQDVELRSRRRYIDLMVNEDSRGVALARAGVIAELRRLLAGRGFVEVETPTLLNQATGATARAFETHHNALDLAMQLRIATELYLKRLVVGGLDRVFEIGRIFRNEGVDAVHNPEFTMLEAYQAYADYGDMAELTEAMVAAAAVAAVGKTVVSYGGRTLDLTPPFRRARMVDLVAEAVGELVDFTAPLDEARDLARRHGVEPDAHWGHGRIVEALFDRLVAESIWQPLLVTDHPREISPLARAHRQDPALTERFELFIAGHEYANAFSELIDPLDQRERFEAQAAARAAGDDEAHPIDEDFLLALEYGMPPTGGLGVGIDRLVMLLTDRHHIREVILFPTLRPEIRG
ncbi:MAG TPA: lysine--tRNA ligase [Acidimicrobiia bacterium]